ncbi:uncharacterized protein LOC131619662 [Vicia villosa]|uniref:uncharacterized protein LOC131619662 n=1 Tax=Vicia villosa TaxID=3911 RepID=UPI00273B7349|nr:uncharacterized protein LOC131619662 [Vicia villosa]
MDLQNNAQPSSTTKKKLNDLIAINVLVAGSCFVGLAIAVVDQCSLKKITKCNLTPDAMEILVMYEIFSYTFVLLSSLVAYSLKTRSLNTLIKERLCRCSAMLPLSIFIVALVFMMLSFMEIAVIKLGNFTCGNNSKITSGVVFIVGSLGGIIYDCDFVYYFWIYTLV